MKLTRVTITGADDMVPHFKLVELSTEFPFVEWGILISKGRFETPRYPSTNWLAGLHACGLVPRCAFHMCGEHARRIMGGDPTLVPHGARRIQLNGFSKYKLPCFLAAEGAPDVEFILQCNTREALQHADALRNRRSNVVALWDPSGGLGMRVMGGWLPDQSDYEIPIGYAGGIDEMNIERTIGSLCDGRGQSIWLDLESGARIGDEFDVDTVRRILKLAAPMVNQ